MQTILLICHFTDINECADDTLNDCDQICINTNGSYVCECDSGYLLNDDLITCSGIIMLRQIYNYYV